MTEWQKESGVECVVCPECAFTFNAVHTLADGSYACPLCEIGTVTEERDAAYETIDAALAMLPSTIREPTNDYQRMINLARGLLSDIPERRALSAQRGEPAQPTSSPASSSPPRSET